MSDLQELLAEAMAPQKGNSWQPNKVLLEIHGQTQILVWLG